MKAVGEEQNRVYEFGPFCLDASERLLLRDGRPVPLAPKVFDTLVALVEKGGRLVTKDELMSRLWPDTIVEEGTITRHISDLRKALGECSGSHPYIETVPRHGYRFVAPVKHLSEETATFIIEKHTRSRIVARQEETETRTDEQARQQSLTPVDETAGRARLLLRPRVMAGLALLVAVAPAVFYFGISKRSSLRSPASVRSIAVLPFKYTGAEESDRYIEIGMADALIARLNKIRQITVRPTSAITKYNGSEQSALAAGRELRVDSVLDGRIERSGERVRVSIELIRVEDGSTLWTETFDSKWADIFTTQDSISEQVIQALALELSSEDKKRLAKRYTENMEAYQAYVKGRFWWNRRGEEGFKRAIEFFNEAISLDRNYALAFAGLADCYAIMSPYGLANPKESYPKAKAAATQALTLDNQLAEAHASLANITWLYEWDFPAAEAQFKQAIELDPNYPTAHQWYSVYLSSMGRHDEAIGEANRARELDPLSLAIIQDLSRAYYHARRYDEAIAAYLKALELNPRYYRMNSWLEMAYAQKGLYDQAIEARMMAMSLIGVEPEKMASLKEAYTMSGWRGYWQKELELNKVIYRDVRFAYQLARTHARLGENDRALVFLETAYKERQDHLVLLKVDPIFDPLRSDPRFTDLLRRIGFER